MLPILGWNSIKMYMPLSGWQVRLWCTEQEEFAVSMIHKLQPRLKETPEIQGQQWFRAWCVHLSVILLKIVVFPHPSRPRKTIDAWRLGCIVIINCGRRPLPHASILWYYQVNISDFTQKLDPNSSTKTGSKSHQLNISGMGGAPKFHLCADVVS